MAVAVNNDNYIACLVDNCNVNVTNSRVIQSDASKT